MGHLASYFGSKPIRLQLLLLVVVVGTVALVVSVVGGVLLEWNMQRQQVRQSLTTTARAAGIAASAAVAFGDTKAAKDSLRILAAQKEIEAAAVYQLDGRRLADFGDSGNLPDRVDGLREHLPRFGLFTPFTTLLQPIVLDGSNIGYIFIRASLDDSRRIYLLQAFLTIGASLLGLVLAIGLGLGFIERIVQPLRTLADTSRQVRNTRNFSLRASSPEMASSGNEIAELVLSFNAMLAEIEQRTRELAESHDRLESMVVERTEALHAANRELRVAKDAAEAATLSKSRFLAAASHDLRQPIQAINLFMYALSKTPMSPEQNRIGNFLSQSIQGLGDLLNALLDISKLDAGAIVPRREVVGVHVLFSSIDAEFSTLASAKSLRFKLQFPFRDLALCTDGRLLQSLLRNLIGNALKYTERGGVLVAIRRRGNQAVIQVWDTGIGIAAEHMDTIFDEYFQVANPERDRAKGLGLGLAIAKRLAQMLGTNIVCRSELGRGSVFEFLVPLADGLPCEGPSPIETDADRQAVSTPLLSGRIAVIEDDFMVANAMKVSLESLGMQATVYCSAEEALADPEIFDADFYISDLRLAGASGVELLDEIERLRDQRINAVLLTGETSADWMDVMQSARWPALFKPVDLPTLLDAIESQRRESAGLPILRRH